MFLDSRLSLNDKRQIVYSEHEFRRKNVSGLGSCFYWSFIHVMNQLIKLYIKNLREKVADFISNMNIDNVKLLHDTDYQSRAQYCDGIRNNQWGGEPEIIALTEMFHIFIVVLNVVRDVQGKLAGNVIRYGETHQLFQTCVYIMYDKRAQHYKPLYLYKNNNPKEYRTIFHHDDYPVLDALAYDFITKQCPCKQIYQNKRHTFSFYL